MSELSRAEERLQRIIELEAEVAELWTKCRWQPIETAPKDGTPILGEYAEGAVEIYWSDRPVCMLGPRCGGFPAGWATHGNDTDRNLPMDLPSRWKPKESEHENEPNIR